MVTLSRFSHTYDLGESVALYHSLRMKPVYLSRPSYEAILGWLENSESRSIDDVPPSIRKEVDELRRFRILTTSEDEDERILSRIRALIPPPAISVCYLILSEQCNLACKYCFLGNNNKDKRSRFSRDCMSEDTANRAVDFFIRQLQLSGNNFNEDNHPVIIFYGGEPLINFSTLVRVSEKINSLRSTVECLKYAELSIVTNGTLLTSERLQILQKLGVAIAISVDGFTEGENSMRVDISGRPVYSRILRALQLCNDHGVDVSLSVTLSEKTIESVSNLLNLLDRYGIKSFGFNIMMSSDSFVLPRSYNEAAAQFLIDAFVELRQRGIYEDRMMRKLKSFASSQLYFSDCAATSGSQIVISPNGQVGICHGCLHNKQYFVTDIEDSMFDARINPAFIEWSQISPINNPDCLSCPALGICGGGCPINASFLKDRNTIHSIDERFCAHSRKTLEFFIHDLYRIIKEHNNT